MPACLSGCPCLQATISLLQVVLPGPLSRRVSALVHWAGTNTVVATITVTFSLGMAAAVAATALQLKYLYLSSAPPGAVSSGQIPTRWVCHAAPIGLAPMVAFSHHAAMCMQAAGWLLSRHGNVCHSYALLHAVLSGSAAKQQSGPCWACCVPAWLWH